MGEGRAKQFENLSDISGADLIRSRGTDVSESNRISA